MTEYGKSMGRALQAVVQMQTDAVRLLRDVERHLPDYKSLIGNYVTLDLGSSIYRKTFIAEGLLRHYSRDGSWADVLGINICFFDTAKPDRLPEPIIIVANLHYQNPTPDQTQKQIRPWDPWYAFLEWAPSPQFFTAVTLEAPLKTEDLKRITMAAAPLFSITSLDDGLKLIDLVGKP